MQDPSALIDSLHPLEIKVLTALAQHGARSSDAAPREDELAQSAGLDPSQVSMAIGWLLAKSLIRIEQETVRTTVSLTEIGEQYFEKYAPIERVLSSLKQAQKTEKRLTIQDIQSSEALQPTQISGVIGTLKKEGAIRIVPGGFLEATGSPSETAKWVRTLLEQLKGGVKKALSGFPDDVQQIIRHNAVRRGNAHEPFRIEDRPERTYALTDEGRAIQGRLSADTAEEVSQLTPELLKDGSWSTKRFRKYSISLRPPTKVAIARLSESEISLAISFMSPVVRTW